MAQHNVLHDAVVWPAATLGRSPLDVLPRVLYVARLAVQAVLRVDAQVGPPVLVVLILVHTGRAVPEN